MKNKLFAFWAFLLIGGLGTPGYCQIQGHWTKTKLCSECEPNGFAFGDSLSGFVDVFAIMSGFEGLEHVFITHDGGATVQQCKPDPKGASGGFGLLWAPTPHDFFFLQGLLPVVFSTDGGTTWGQRPTQAPYRYNSFDGMVSPEDRVVVGKPVGPSHPWQIYLATDSGSTLLPLGDTLIGASYNGGDPGSIAPSPASAAVMMEYLHTYYHSYVATTSDSGYHWRYSFPVDTIGWNLGVQFSPIVKGVGNGHYYLTGGRCDTLKGGYGRIDDYIETTNDGVNWKVHSDITGGRVFRIANPAPGSLRLLVGRVNQQDFQVTPMAGAYDKHQFINGIPRWFVDSIFFSEDNGQTWTKDGTTFAGDTITDMLWLSPTNGYVLVYHDTGTYLCHYTASSDGVEQFGIEYQSNGLDVFPNPAENLIHVSLSGKLSFPAEYTIEDELGHVVQRGQAQSSEFTLPLDQLPAGKLYIHIQMGDDRRMNKFVVLH